MESSNKKLSTLFVLLFIFPLSAQDIKIGDLIKFKSSILTSSQTNKDTLHANIVFRIQNIEGESIYVEALPFTENGYKKVNLDGKDIIIEKENGKLKNAIPYEEASLYVKLKANERTLANTYNDKIFKLDKKNFTDNFEKAISFDRVTLGVLSLPVKFRFQEQSTFETNFNIGATVGLRLFTNPFSPYAFYVQTGINIGTTKLTNTNSSIEPEKEINASLGTILFGAMFQYKKIQSGIYLGYDFISNQKEYSWNYHGKPWLSIGIGIDVFENKDVKINSQ